MSFCLDKYLSMSDSGNDLFLKIFRFVILLRFWLLLPILCNYHAVFHHTKATIISRCWYLYFTCIHVQQRFLCVFFWVSVEVVYWMPFQFIVTKFVKPIFILLTIQLEILQKHTEGLFLFMWGSSGNKIKQSNLLYYQLKPKKKHVQ